MKSQLRISVLTLVAAAGTLYPALRPSHPWLVYNPSHSVPRGWYVIREQETYQLGSIVLTHLPPAAAAFAAQRGYLAAATPLLKRVGAVAPQTVCVRNGLVRIDGNPVAAIRATDALGRPLRATSFCDVLEMQQVFVLSSEVADSFDSRNFGPIERKNIIGVAHPVRTP